VTILEVIQSGPSQQNLPPTVYGRGLAILDAADQMAADEAKRAPRRAPEALVERYRGSAARPRRSLHPVAERAALDLNCRGAQLGGPSLKRRGQRSSGCLLGGPCGYALILGLFPRRREPFPSAPLPRPAGPPERCGGSNWSGWRNAPDDRRGRGAAVRSSLEPRTCARDSVATPEAPTCGAPSSG